MVQEDKQLLLTDLCARLAYKCAYSASRGITHWNKLILNIDTITKLINNEYDDIKPYLRPMSSMTEEEKIKLYQIAGFYYLSNNELLKNEWIQFSGALSENKLFLPYPIWEADLNKAYDWLNAYHFDYRGLILKGLAIAVTEENNPYKG